MPSDESSDDIKVRRPLKGIVEISDVESFGISPRQAPAKAQDGSRKPPSANLLKSKPSSDKRS